MPRSKPRSALGNLPTPLSTFIGREREIAEVKRLLVSHRLVTLTGPGGSGKTRLALEVANELWGEYEAGVWLAELASLSDDTLVTQTIASYLNVREQSGRPLIDTLVDHLFSRHALLVIDNCEHLIHACAQFADTILQRCPNFRILATSRQMSGITGESVWTVPPLTLSEQQSWKSPASTQTALRIFERSEAVQLFVDRAASLVRGFALNKENGAWISEICRRLDGMPLAIELAAARVQTLSVQQIAERLDDRFKLLAEGSRTADARQQTLRATLDWSYDLLPEKEQKLFMRFAVFAGGATLEAVEAVCSGEGIESAEVLALLSHLVNKSLVTASEPEPGGTRYHLLETIREYGHERLEESQEMSFVNDRYLDFFLRLVEEAEIKLRGAEEIIWYKRLEKEYDNLRAAFGWAFESRNVDAGIRLACGLNLFRLVRGYLNEGIDWLEKALELRQLASKHSTAGALRSLGALLLVSRERDLDQIVILLEESLNLYLELEDKEGIAWVLNLLGTSALERKEYTKAKHFLNQSLELRRELGVPWCIAHTLQNFAPIFLREHDYASAKRYSEETIIWFERAGYKRGIARNMADLADIARQNGGRLGRRIGITDTIANAIGATGRQVIDSRLNKSLCRSGR